MSQSTELTGGAGFVYESHVAAYFMSALLAETVRPPLQSKIKSVRLQQSALGAPLDDIIIELDTSVKMKAHFQVKRSLTISSAKTNKDFKEIVINSWKTYLISKSDKCNDIYGALTDDITVTSLRNAQNVCEVARGSESSEAFWALEAIASKKFKEFISVLRKILGDAQIQTSPLDLYEFLKGFYIECLRIMIPGSPLATAAINELKAVLHTEQRTTDLWESIKGIAREGSGQAATYNKRSLQQKLKLFSFNDESINLPSQVNVAPTRTGVVHVTPMNCILALSHVSIIHSDVALTSLIVTDEPEGLSGQITSWKDRIARSALIPDGNRSEIDRQSLVDILAQPTLASILLQDLAVASFSAYVYYASKCEVETWSSSKYELEFKTLPLFHRLSNKREFIGEIYSAEIDAKTYLEAATSLVMEKYHREVKAPVHKLYASKTSVIQELADAIAQITANFIAGDQIAISQMGYIKTRIRYGENVVTREKHLRDRNPLA